MTKPIEDMSFDELTKAFAGRKTVVQDLIWQVEKLSPENFAIAASVIEMLSNGESIYDSLSVTLRDYNIRQNAKANGGDKK